MASLPARQTASFFAIQPIPSATPLDDELNAFVGASGFLKGGTTGIKLLFKTSDASDPPLECDQVGAGPLAEWKQNGTLKASIANTGQIVSAVTTGTAPLSIASATKVDNLNADLLDGLNSDAFAVLATSVSAWTKTWLYPVLPAAIQTVETVERVIIPVSTAFTVTSITSVWAAGSDSSASNIFTIKRRNAAGTLQADVGTIDINAQGQDVLNPGAVSVALTAGDQLYPLFTTRNTASEQMVSITIRGTQRLT